MSNGGHGDEPIVHRTTHDPHMLEITDDVLQGAGCQRERFFREAVVEEDDDELTRGACTAPEGASAQRRPPERSAR